MSGQGLVGMRSRRGTGLLAPRPTLARSVPDTQVVASLRRHDMEHRAEIAAEVVVVVLDDASCIGFLSGMHMLLTAPGSPLIA